MGPLSGIHDCHDTLLMNMYKMENFKNKNKIDEKYVCKKCNELLFDVHQTECGCRYCAICLEKIILEEKCIICEEVLSNKNGKLPDKAFQKEVDNLKLNCPECTWSGNLIEYKDHYKEHAKSILECPYAKFGCTYHENAIHDHLKNDAFQHLDLFSNQTNERINGIENEIENLKKKTKNESIPVYNGGLEIKKKLDMLEEISLFLKKDISNITILTESANRRNDEFSIRERKLNEELENTKKALTLAQTQIISLENELAERKHATYNGMYVWKITHVRDKIQEAKSGRQTSIYSSPFYTSQYGYKMCARLYLNGDGTGRNTHLSLFFVIMRGEYDSLLKWPFRQKVTFMLMDQSTIESHENIIDAFRPDPNSNSFKKPTSDMNIASGIPKFCRLSKLHSTDHEYIKDDCMFIKVIVDSRDLLDI